MNSKTKESANLFRYNRNFEYFCSARSRFENNRFWSVSNNSVASENLLKLVESKKILFLKSKNNSKKAVFLESKKDSILDKIDKSSLLEFSI